VYEYVQLPGIQFHFNDNRVPITQFAISMIMVFRAACTETECYLLVPKVCLDHRIIINTGNVIVMVEETDVATGNVNGIQMHFVVFECHSFYLV